MFIMLKKYYYFDRLKNESLIKFLKFFIKIINFIKDLRLIFKELFKKN